MELAAVRQWIPSPAAWLARLPGSCACCHTWTAARVCADCVGRFAAPRVRCQRCAAALPTGATLCGACLRDPPPFEAAWAAVDYAYPWSVLVPRFKFRQGLDLGGALAELMLSAAGPTCLAQAGARVVVPAPLSRARLRQRGYNQAQELARRLARRRGWTLAPEVVHKVRDTAEQMTLLLSARAGNVRGAYAVKPAQRQVLAGRHVVLVDDVMTSGATLREIAHVLQTQAGAASVEAWVFARTPSPHSLGT
ncbi:MAG: ComF family protein [Pseudomonadota bacterium]